MASITKIMLVHIGRALRELGADVSAILGRHAAGLDTTRFEDRIPVDDLIEIWERAVAATGRDDLAPLALEYSVHDERSLITFVVANEPRFGDGVDLFDRYAPTISDLYCWRVVDDDRDLRIVASPMGPAHRPGWQRHLEYESLDIIRSAARLTGGRAVASALRYVHTEQSATAAAAIARSGGVQPAFAQDRCEIVFPRSIRELPVAGARRALATVVRAQLDAMVEAIASNTLVTARARAAIDQLLGAADLGADALARALGLSRRSLDRALSAEGTSAARLVEDERKQRALAWLPAMSVEEVATRLGYSDARAFARAFKRWTGVSPRSARR